jgi:hypothetical protein
LTSSRTQKQALLLSGSIYRPAFPPILDLSVTIHAANTFDDVREQEIWNGKGSA